MRTVRLFTDWRKQGEPEVVNWHCFGQGGDEKEGLYLAAIVEMPNGNVEEVLADRLQFIEPAQQTVAVDVAVRCQSADIEVCQTLGCMRTGEYLLCESCANPYPILRRI